MNINLNESVNDRQVTTPNVMLLIDTVTRQHVTLVQNVIQGDRKATYILTVQLASCLIYSQP